MRTKVSTIAATSTNEMSTGSPTNSKILLSKLFAPRPLPSNAVIAASSIFSLACCFCALICFFSSFAASLSSFLVPLSPLASLLLKSLFRFSPIKRVLLFYKRQNTNYSSAAQHSGTLLPLCHHSKKRQLPINLYTRCNCLFIKIIRPVRQFHNHHMS
ncbi:hypothetical protein SDC9_155208 [bioreactor metagenome]|uniref:Uncharacterized protein n=1 Tax=bioreactor metagenome TaxID=1076179 RepID=A0A645F0W2_9ZZZZ